MPDSKIIWKKCYFMIDVLPYIMFMQLLFYDL